MFLHTVYFWLKPDLTAEQVREFETRCRAGSTFPPSTRAIATPPCGVNWAFQVTVFYCFTWDGCRPRKTWPNSAGLSTRP